MSTGGEKKTHTQKKKYSAKFSKNPTDREEEEEEEEEGDWAGVEGNGIFSMEK
jgi:hypothetical protein